MNGDLDRDRAVRLAAFDWLREQERSPGARPDPALLRIRYDRFKAAS